MKSKLKYIFIFFPLFAKAQFQIVPQKAWTFSVGNAFNLPITKYYYDDNIITGSDYFWQYKVTPRASLFVPQVSVSFAKAMDYNGINFGFYDFGISYRQQQSKITYDGWEGGGIAGIYYKGTGTKIFTEHFVVLNTGITQQFGIRKTKLNVLNSLSLSAAFLVYGNVNDDYKGTKNNSAYERNTTMPYYSSPAWLPLLKLNYRFAFVLNAKKFYIMPYFETVLLNLSNYYLAPFPEHAPLTKRKEYYKEISFGIAFMPGRFTK